MPLDTPWQNGFLLTMILLKYWQKHTSTSSRFLELWALSSKALEPQCSCDLEPTYIYYTYVWHEKGNP